MKTLAISIFSFVLFSIFFFPASAQSNDIFLEINKVDDKIVSKAENGERTLIFNIGGFTTKQQVDEFAEKFKTMRGVISVNVADDAIDGKWNATAVFYKYANKKYFQNLFSWLSINYIIVDNIKYLVEEIASAKFE
jgi:hypothetical protein